MKTEGWSGARVGSEEWMASIRKVQQGVSGNKTLAISIQYHCFCIVYVKDATETEAVGLSQ